MTALDETNHLPTTAWETLRSLFEKRVAGILTAEGVPIQAARFQSEQIAGIAFELFREPDRAMISRGMTALETATSRRRPIEQRQLVAEIFVAMVRAAE